MPDRLLAARLAAVGLAGLALAVSTPGVAAAGATWWVTAPSSRSSVSALASNSSAWTLAVAAGRAGWIDPSRGYFDPLSAPAGAELVAAHGATGLVLFRDGSLLEVHRGGLDSPLQRLSGRPLGLGIGTGARPFVLALTSDGLWRGRLGSRLLRSRSPAGASALATPVEPGQPFVVAAAQGVFRVLPDGQFRRLPHSPGLGPHASATELGDGAVLAGDYRGLLWEMAGGQSQPVFQMLPYGGLGGVPHLTSLVGVGPEAAYLGSAGFGTLLTPDGGYSWYSAPPPASSGTVLDLATLGPVYAPRGAHGLVVAVTPQGLFLHRLQELPEAPVYSGSDLSSQLWATAAVTALAAALALCLMWLARRGIWRWRRL